MMKKKYDVIVVGAGPAGSMAARFAAENNVSVLMLEKDREVGSPVRCAEAINLKTVGDFIKPDDKWIAAKITKFAFVAPDGEEVVVEFNSVEGYVLERKIFDYELAKQASNAGAEVITRAYVNGLIFEKNKVCGVKVEYRGKQLEIRAKVVIAADGTESRVGRWAGLKTHIDFRDMESCFQVTASNVKVDPNTLYFYLGSNFAPGGYFWVFPKGNDLANIGLGINGLEGKKRSALSYLNENMQKFFPNASILTQVAGGVPCAITLSNISGDGILLTGDAARQVNPLSGGGIASGMIGGSIAGRIAAESIKKCNPEHLYSYDKEWHKARGQKHEIFERLKEGLYSIDDEGFNKMVKKMQKIPTEKRTLGKLFMTVLANKPSLLIDVAKVYMI
ncbi:MAG TPA: NAD(P)/FAD-dependent oxidoreductase [Ignavibacteriaceae bacterium]|nr:NAD(P)/FAD-dependent oxidoreductase [Ignavibacteriaceae bacterium]